MIGVVLHPPLPDHALRPAANFKWNMVDWAAVFYFLMLTASQIITQGPAKAINNRGGFFLSAMVPFWCVPFPHHR